MSKATAYASPEKTMSHTGKRKNISICKKKSATSVDFFGLFLKTKVVIDNTFCGIWIVKHISLPQMAQFSMRGGKIATHIYWFWWQFFFSASLITQLGAPFVKALGGTNIF